MEQNCQSLGTADQRTKFPLHLLSWPLSVYTLPAKSLYLKGQPLWGAGVVDFYLGAELDGCLNYAVHERLLTLTH